MLCSSIQFIGIVNSMTESAAWKVDYFSDELVTIDGKSSSKHPHTFEVTCYIQTKGFIAFEFIENKINQILNQLND